MVPIDSISPFNFTKAAIVVNASALKDGSCEVTWRNGPTLMCSARFRIYSSHKLPNEDLFSILSFRYYVLRHQDNADHVAVMYRKFVAYIACVNLHLFWFTDAACVDELQAEVISFE